MGRYTQEESKIQPQIYFQLGKHDPIPSTRRAKYSKIFEENRTHDHQKITARRQREFPEDSEQY